MAALLESHIASLATPRKGKVREVYDLGNEVLIVATDRISAFDVVMENGIPDKGRVLNQLSAFWFRMLGDLCAHHMISIDDDDIAQAIGVGDPSLSGRAMLAKKATTLPIECVARGYICGSLFKDYRRDGCAVHELGLPEGLLDGSRLPEPIFTPATKAESGHDENLSFRQAADIVGRENAEWMRSKTLSIYAAASDYALSKGLILADTKFEFGESAEGIIWIDEALTPDSSRYWEASTWEPGGAQPSFDKQFVRDFLEASGWNKQPPGPLLPDNVVIGTRQRYLDAFERLTGIPLAV